MSSLLNVPAAAQHPSADDRLRVVSAQNLWPYIHANDLLACARLRLFKIAHFIYTRAPFTIININLCRICSNATNKPISSHTYIHINDGLHINIIKYPPIVIIIIIGEELQLLEHKAPQRIYFKYNANMFITKKKLHAHKISI